METAPNVELSARIRHCAKIAGSGDELARLTKIPRRTLENYLSGKNEPKTGALVSIARAAGVRVDWLATGEGASGVDQPVDEELAHRLAQCADIVNGAKPLADTAGIPLKTLEGYISGEGSIDARTLKAIADAAGVNVEWLTTGKGPTEAPKPKTPPRRGLTGPPASQFQGSNDDAPNDTANFHEVFPACTDQVDRAIKAGNHAVSPKKLSRLYLLVHRHVICSEKYLNTGDTTIDPDVLGLSISLAETWAENT